MDGQKRPPYTHSLCELCAKTQQLKLTSVAQTQNTIQILWSHRCKSVDFGHLGCDVVTKVSEKHIASIFRTTEKDTRFVEFTNVLAFKLIHT
jgi:hypothetical protein